MEPSAQQNPSQTSTNRDPQSNQLVEKIQTPYLTASINVKNLLSYQDVMNAIEREFHLHAGQEREIIMKLWLKGQTMVSILQRFRHLLQDLNIDDKDFTEGLKKIREIINYSNRDVQHLREKTAMLENENRSLDHEFRRQLDKIVEEKNGQITRLMQILNQRSLKATSLKTSSNNESRTPETEELSKRFLQQNNELQSEIENFHGKLDQIVTFINTKFNQEKSAPPNSAVSMIQIAFEQMQQTEIKLLELKLKSISQQEENDLLKYLMQKSQNTFDIEQSKSFAIIKQRSLEREMELVRQELEATEKKTAEFQQKFKNSDETVQFFLENLKLKCDILRKHIVICSQQLDEMSQVNLLQLQQESQFLKNKNLQDSNADKRAFELEKELTHVRELHNELIEHTNRLQSELTDAQKQLAEQQKLERSLNNDLEHERQRANSIEVEFKTLKIKYDDVCERIRAATHQLEHVQVVLEQTSRRCEQLEKEKSEINAQSEYLTQNVIHITSKYKEKLNTVKVRLESTELEKRELQYRNEQYYNEIERLKDELLQQKEVLYEKERVIQDAQYKNREILLQRQSIEERISSEHRRLDELIEKNSQLEEELDRFRRSQLSENTVRLPDNFYDTSKQIDELKLQLDQIEQHLLEEKSSKESLQVQMKILEEENTDLREIMNQMRKRAQYGRKEERDRNDEIHQLIARAELNARQYMTSLNLTSLTSQATYAKIIPLSSAT